MSSTEQATSTRTPSGPAGEGSGRNPFLAIGLFIRQVIAELRKVVVPSRRELLGYTITVLGFVFVMILIVFGLDIAFGYLARLVFTAGGTGS